MPLAKKNDVRSRNIRDFFKPFTIPKNRIPINNTVEDEIIVAPARACSPNEDLPTHSHVSAQQDTGTEHKVSLPPSSSALSSLTSLISTDEDIVTPKPSTALLQPDDVSSDELRSGSPPSSQKRGTTAVELPISKRKQADLPASTETNHHLPKMSFSSFSSLTSVPASTSSSSRRIVKNGVHAVTNSDSGSVDSSSSEDELADVSTFIPRKRAKLVTDENTLESAMEATGAIKSSKRQSARLSESSKRSSRVATPQRETTPPRAVYKHSLLNMVKQRNMEAKTEANLREMEAEFEESERQRASESKREDEDARGVKAAVADDSDEGERMMLAMQRTEAMGDEEELYYFQGVRNDRISASLSDTGIGDDSPDWVEKLHDEQWRMQACLTGFLAECVVKDGLPGPLRDWVAHQLLHEKREDLCEAYIGVLDACKKTEREPTTPSFRSFSKFCYLQDQEKEGRPGNGLSGANQELSRALSYATRVMRHFSAECGDDAIASSILELAYANIDAHVQKDAALKCLVEDSIEYLLDAVDNEEWVPAQLCTSIASSKLSLQLKCRAILSLPARSVQSHALRRQLALALVCGGALPGSVTSLIYGDRILSRLKEAPEFQISESSNYVLLNSLISLLDIALDAAFTDDELGPPLTLPTKKKIPTLGEESTSKASAEAEKTFNTRVDSFVDQLTLMSSRIKDAGTTHLRRTEAKHAIERVVKRLEYGVRTRPRPRQKTFGGVTGDVQRNFFSGFLKRAGTKSTPTGIDEGGGEANTIPADSLRDELKDQDVLLGE